MSFRFSRVSVIAKKKVAIFLVGGKPKCYDDLKNRPPFKDFINGLYVNETINAHVETFIFGEGEPTDANDEEIKIIYNLIQLKPDFIENIALKCDEDDIFIWG